MLHVVYRVGDMDRTIKYICFMSHLIGCSSWLSGSVTRDYFCIFTCWPQILHRVSWDETAAKARYTRRKIHQCISWIWA